MARSLLLNPTAANKPEKTLTAITPSRQAARRLGVPHRPLDRIAISVLSRHQIAIAPPLTGDRIWRKIVAENLTTNDPEGTARTLIPSRQMLLRSGVDLQELIGYDSPRIRELAELTRRYEEELKERGYIDRAQLFWWAASYRPKPADLFIYGYFQPQPDQVKFIDAVAGENSVWVLPSGDADFMAKNQQAIATLQDSGWIVDAGEISEHLTLGERLQSCFLEKDKISHSIQFHVYPNLEAEIRGVLAQVKDLIQRGTSAREIAIATRDERTYGPLLLDIAWEYNLPLRIFYQIPLRDTQIGAWMELLLEVVQNNFPFEQTAKLLRHPLARQLTPNLWAKARQTRPNNLDDWQQLGLDLSVLEFPESDTRGNWIERIQMILKKFEIRKNAGVWSREIVAYSKLDQSLVELSRPEGDRISKPAFCREILEIMTLLTAPIQPGRGGVEVHTPFSLQGASYEQVFLLGFAEGMLPALIENDPVLDFYDRQQISRRGVPLETAVDVARSEALSFYELLRIPTKSLTFSYPSQQQKASLIPSSYATRLGLTATPPDSLPLASLEEARRYYLQQPERLPSDDAIAPQAIRAWQIEERRESSEIPDEYDGVIGIPTDPQKRTFSASQLTAIGQCPFKWFANYLLHLKDLPEAEAELSPSLRGRLYHRCLELLLKEIKNRADLMRLGREEIEATFGEAEQDIEVPNLTNWEGRRLEHLEMLELNLRAESFLPENAEILQLETSFQADWYGLKVRGVVDRIDRTPEGLVLLDYKTSGSVPPGIKDESGRAKIDLQLALYENAIAQNFENEKILESQFYSLTKQKYLSKSKPDPETLEAFAEKVKRHLETGSYPVDPDIEQKACQYCEFDAVCRKGTRLSRKRSPMEKQEQ
ncbi:PD-(D/E)XK nuclease family protein [Lyngbya sp. CCY1209]|uniref:PD-(D/E)XK nuclease family protein n=1 Tax=Lyngbya sp. CCY1209 TaxID=2886103 RepID=UPI002D216A46|nr:PD-(D/E)XK nuclease family protein [Lyngbya sp. CCY1209]MEB3884859.1 PD-(D/E)XK nuclease family protein [Lyngbya sp. CCY1209]